MTLAKIEIAQGWRVEDIGGLPVLRKIMRMSREDLMKLKNAAQSALQQQQADSNTEDKTLHTSSKVADKVLNTVLRQTASALNMAEAQYEDLDKGTPMDEQQPKFDQTAAGRSKHGKKGGVRAELQSSKGKAKKLERLKLTWEVMQVSMLVLLCLALHGLLLQCNS